MAAAAGPSTVKECLEAIGLQSDSLGGCGNVQEEWSVIKKMYFRKILKCHPDKGGSADEFRAVRAAFEGLRLIYLRGVSFKSSASLRVDENQMDDVARTKAPSWDFYQAAAAEVVPKYRVELAKSNRSRCVAKGIGAHSLLGAPHYWVLLTTGCSSKAMSRGCRWDPQGQHPGRVAGSRVRWLWPLGASRMLAVRDARLTLRCLLCAVCRVPSSIWLGIQNLLDNPSE